MQISERNVAAGAGSDIATLSDRRRGAYALTTDPARVDIDRVHEWLAEQSWWAAGRERDVVVATVAGSLPYSVFVADTEAVDMVAFARVVTDRVTFAWICDVFVDTAHRGRGLGTWLVNSVVEDLSAQGVKRFVLATKDAHEVYRRCGFSSLAAPERWMEIDRRTTRVE